MKRICLCLVALLMLVTLPATAQTLALDYEGITMTLPDDFELAFSDDGDTAQVFMYTSKSIPDTTFIITAAAEEDPFSASVEDKLNALYESIADDLHEATHNIVQIGDAPFLIIDEATDYEEIYATIWQGFVIQITCLATGDAPLSPDHALTLEGIASSLQVEALKAE